jgi:hypothetical protein
VEDPRLVARALAQKDPGWVDDLWLKYWAHGGSADRIEFDAFLRGITARDPYELRILAWAIDDLDPAAPARKPVN